MDDLSRSTAVSRRAAMRLAGSVAAGIALLPRWVSADHEQASPFTGETFVGETAEPVTFVAVVVGKATPGTATREARALVYGDPENAIAEWFNVGAVGSSELDLRAESGGSLTAGLAPDGIAGTIRLPDGRSFAFKAAPAEGTAGLYTLTATPDGLLRGASAEGAHLEGLIARSPLVEPPEARGRYLAVGILTPSAGEPRIFATAVTTFPAESLPTRFIVAADGRIRGGVDVHPIQTFKADPAVAIIGPPA